MLIISYIRVYLLEFHSHAFLNLLRTHKTTRCQHIFPSMHDNMLRIIIIPKIWSAFLHSQRAVSRLQAGVPNVAINSTKTRRNAILLLLYVVCACIFWSFIHMPSSACSALTKQQDFWQSFPPSMIICYMLYMITIHTALDHGCNALCALPPHRRRCIQRRHAQRNIVRDYVRLCVWL